MNWMRFLTHGLPVARARDPSGLRYAVLIFAGTTAVWLLLRPFGDANPVWAVISLIIVTEPQTSLAWQALLARILNTVIGCVTALLFLLVAGTELWVLPVALTVTVLVCTYVFHVPQAWRVGPVTAALVLAAGVTAHSRETGMEVAARRAAEVFLGCVVALATTWLSSLVWPLQVPVLQPGTIGDGQDHSPQA